MTRQQETLSEVDASLHLWLDDPHDPRIDHTRNEVVRLLRARGWKIGIDPDVKKRSSCIAHHFHRGKHPSGLEVKTSASGRHLEIKFFQNVANGENKHGGEYDFNRRSRMPYLIGLRYEAEVRAITRRLAEMGLPAMEREKRNQTKAQMLEADRLENEAFHRRRYWEEELHDYNVVTPDGRMVDGAEAYVLDGGMGDCGRWVRGRVFLRLNNCHSLILPDGRTAFATNSRTRMTKPENLRGRHFDPDLVRKRLEAEKAGAVKAENYERAAVLRNVIARHAAGGRA